MANVMADGTVTYKWDERSSATLQESVDSLNTDFRRFKDSFIEQLHVTNEVITKTNELTQQVDKLERMLMETNMVLLEDTNALKDKAYFIMIFLFKFLLWAPIRGLNYIFHWYVLRFDYSDDESPLAYIRIDPVTSNFSDTMYYFRSHYKAWHHLFKKENTFKLLKKNTINMLESHRY